MSRRNKVLRFLRVARKRYFAAAALHGFARFLALLGVLMLTAWSYSIWGSPASPVSHLLVPGVLLLIAAPVLAKVGHRLIRPRGDAIREIRAAREVAKS